MQSIIETAGSLNLSEFDFFLKTKSPQIPITAFLKALNLENRINKYCYIFYSRLPCVA